MKILYCGFARAGLECLNSLLLRGVQAKDILVFTHDTEENGKFREFLDFSKIEYTFEPINRCAERVEEFKPDYLLSVYYRYIVSGQILEMVSGRAMNLHPSLLPKYRGTKSSVWALLQNERQTGISFHYMNEKIDDGRIILSKSIDILETDTAFSLYHKLISLFVANFSAAFERLVDGFTGIEQVGSPSYFKRELPFGGKRRLSEISYDEATRFVRAMYFPPFKGALFILPNNEVVEISDVRDLDAFKGFCHKEGH